MNMEHPSLKRIEPTEEKHPSLLPASRTEEPVAEKTQQQLNTIKETVATLSVGLDELAELENEILESLKRKLKER